MITRRNALAGGLALAGLPIIGKTSPVKSMLGANNTSQESDTSSTPTARDYIQDGLIAMWDGIENAGFGIHNPTLSGWKDLSENNYHLTKEDENYQQTWNEDSLIFDGLSTGNGVLWVKSSSFNNSIRTVECICSVQSNSSWQCVMSLGNGYKASVYVDTNGYLTCRDMSSESLRNVTATATWTFDASPSNSTPTHIYKNGIEAIPLTKTFSRQYNTSTLMLGQNYKSGDKYYGEIYNIRLYDRALTSEEISSNHRIDKVRFGI